MATITNNHNHNIYTHLTEYNSGQLVVHLIHTSILVHIRDNDGILRVPQQSNQGLCVCVCMCSVRCRLQLVV